MWLHDVSFQNFLTPEISKRHFNIQFQLWVAVKTYDFNNNKKILWRKGFGLFQTYILRLFFFFPSFWSNITIRIFNISNISEFCYSSGWRFLQKPQTYTNKLKTRENLITGVRRGPGFYLHSGFSFRLSENICRGYICTLPNLKFLTNQTIWGVWTWDLGSVFLKIKRFHNNLKKIFALLPLD